MTFTGDSTPWRLEWSDALSMFIAEVDVEHRRFIQLVNELNEAIVARMDLAEIKKRMQAILDDSAAHFTHEEALFRELGYPGAAEHAQRHAQVTLVLREIMGRLEHGATECDWIQAGLQVKQVLIDHLLTEDLKYRDYCLGSGRARDAKSTEDSSAPGADGDIVSMPAASA